MKQFQQITMTALGIEFTLDVQFIIHPGQSETRECPGCPDQVEITGVWHERDARNESANVLRLLTASELEEVYELTEAQQKGI